MNGQTLVMAWGNDYRRDDGAGRWAAQRLREMHRPGLTVIDVNQLCPEHAELLAGVDRVIFLDAYPAGPEQRALLLPLDDPAAMALPRSCFGHAVQPVEILTLARAIYDAEPEAWLAALPGFDFALGEFMTPPTQRAVDDIIQKILALINAAVPAGKNQIAPVA